MESVPGRRFRWAVPFLLTIAALAISPAAATGEWVQTDPPSGDGGSIVCCVLPPHGANEVSTTQRIAVGFTEAMDPASMPSHFELNPPAEGTSGWMDSFTFFFEPRPGLQPSTTYTAKVTAGARAQSGTSLSRDHVWSFATRAPGISGVDLYVDANTTTVAPTTAVEGQVVSVTVVVGNRGTVDVNLTEVAIAVDTPAQPLLRTVAPMISGGTQSFEAKWRATLGTHRILFAVDPGNVTGDAAPGNNLHELTVTVAERPPGGLPDMAPVRIVLAPAPLVEGDGISFALTIGNLGTAAVETVDMLLVEDRVRGTRMIDSRAGGLLAPRGQPNSSVTFYLNYSGPGIPVVGKHHLELIVDPDDRSLEDDESNNRLTLEYTVLPATATPPTDSPEVRSLLAQAMVGSTVAGIAVAGLAFAASTEHGKYAMFSALLPLFTRIRREKVLDHFVRGQVYEHIKRDPGVHYNELRFKLSLSNGVLAHHLRTLEMQGFIQSQRVGMYRCFYPIAMKVPRGAGVKFSDLQLKMMARLRENPGMSQMQIAKELGVSQQVASYNLKVLARHGALRTAKPEDVVRYYLEEDADPGTEAPPGKKPREPAAPGR